MANTGKRHDHAPRPLDRASPLPLWAQLRADLERRLAAGAFAERFPSDDELTRSYQVSRQTAREAVRRLGPRLDRQRGKGTFLRPPEFVQPVGVLYSLFQVIEAQGVEQRSVVRALDERVDSVVAERLELSSDQPMVYLERLRLAGGAPLALDQAWLPASLARPLLDTDFTHTALYDELARRCHLRPEQGEERIHPVVPDRADARLLGLQPREAAFALERRTFAQGQPIEYRRTAIRGDRYGFVSTWNPTEPTAVLRLINTAS